MAFGAPGSCSHGGVRGMASLCEEALLHVRYEAAGGGTIYHHQGPQIGEEKLAIVPSQFTGREEAFGSG